MTPSERTELRGRMRSRTLAAEDVRRARLILLLAQGKSYLTIRQLLGCNPNYISRWKGRFEAERLAGLYSRHSGRAVEKRTPALEAKILEWTRRPAADGSKTSRSRKGSFCIAGSSRVSRCGRSQESIPSLGSRYPRQTSRDRAVSCARAQAPPSRLSLQHSPWGYEPYQHSPKSLLSRSKFPFPIALMPDSGNIVPMEEFSRKR